MPIDRSAYQFTYGSPALVSSITTESGGTVRIAPQIAAVAAVYDISDDPNTATPIVSGVISLGTDGSRAAMDVAAADACFEMLSAQLSLGVTTANSPPEGHRFNLSDGSQIA
jgi:hypothetical protein